MDDRYILLIEDNPADMMLVEEALDEISASPQIIYLTDGQKAVDHLQQPSNAVRLPALIVVDLNLPRVTGMEVIRAIRSDSAYNSVPVLVLSTSGALEDRRQAMEFGATQYIQKPASYRELQAIAHAIQGLLSSRARA